MLHNKKAVWYTQGKEPDYRFSLANERTYLAWIRTALALLAGAIAIDHFFLSTAPGLLRLSLSILLCLSSSTIAIFAYHRWQSNENAMRKQSSLVYTPFLKFFSILIFILAILVIFGLSL